MAISLEQLASQLGRSVQSLLPQLDLVKLPERIESMVEDCETNGRTISLDNACALAELCRFAPEEVDDYVEEAKCMYHEDFNPIIMRRVINIQLEQGLTETYEL